MARFLKAEDRNKLIKNTADDPLFSYPHNITMKCSLDQILKNKDIKDILMDAINRTNIIVYHTYNFLKLYILHKYDKRLILPTIDKQFISTITLIISKKNKNSGKPLSYENQLIFDGLIEFYKHNYEPLITDTDKVFIDKLGYILNYEEEHILTNIENNIKEHFVDRVNEYVNISFNVKSLAEKVSHDKIKRQAVWDRFRKIKQDLLSIPGTEYTSDPEFHQWISSKRKYILPREPQDAIRLFPCQKPKKYKNTGHSKTDLFVQIRFMDEMSLYKHHLELNNKTINEERINPKIKSKFAKTKEGVECVNYDVHVNPFQYLYPMIFINREIDKTNQRIKKEFDNNPDKKTTHPLIHKLFHVLPLRTSNIPSYITLDTPALINLLIKENQGWYLKNYSKNNLFAEIWSKYFNLNDKIFKRKNYQFNYMIKTDGLACSLIFVKAKDGVKYLPASFGQKKTIDEANQCKYIEEILSTYTEEEIIELCDKNFIYLDPGKNALFDARGIDVNGTYNTFTYTQRQRNDAIRKKRYDDIRTYLRRSNIVDEKTIEEYQSTLSKYDSKTTITNDFKLYVREKTKINNLVYSHYQIEDHRKLKWNTYNNIKRSEDKMLNSFECIFGGSDKCVIILGDYSEKNNKKGNEPSITKKLRKLFKKRGYEVYLIDEYNTSKLCNKCSHETENFVIKNEKNPKKWTKEEIQKNSIKITKDKLMKLNK